MHQVNIDNCIRQDILRLDHQWRNCKNESFLQISPSDKKQRTQRTHQDHQYVGYVASLSQKN